jgi:alpha-tubulin suppressor-like RCC1 family protein
VIARWFRLVGALVVLGAAGLTNDTEIVAAASPSATAVALGWIHTCALTGGGDVMCWGYNRHNELGDGTRVERWRPVRVSGLDGNVRSITTGARHGCALTDGGAVKCWGYNYYGQLGDGSNADHPAAVDVPGLTRGVTAIAAGALHTCALTSSGVKCWGYNGAGQLGDGTDVERWTPVDLASLGDDVISIAAGDSHSCAILRSGGVKCWGDNRYGQLGDGTTERRLTPVGVSALSGGVTALALGDRHSCAIDDGAVKCWGDNRYGELGDGTTLGRLTPVAVPGLSGAIAIAAGSGPAPSGHTCALMRSGAMKCWGYNGWAQLGDGTTVDRRRPVGVAGLGAGVTAIAAGARHTCARTTTGNLRCWGYNYNGQLGDETPDDRSKPVYVVGIGPAPVTLTIASHSVTVTPAKRTAIRLHCGAAGRCVGILWLSARMGRDRAPVRLGARAFSIPARVTAAATLTLHGRAVRVLSLDGRLPGSVHVRYAQPDGTTSEVSRRIVLKAASA